MLGDAAVAVHPDDERYKHLVGKFVKHPFVDRRLPIIADKFVAREFGTGAVKITPAHDHTDYEVGKRHNLPFISIFDNNGAINENGGPLFQGMMRFDARLAITEALKQRKLFHSEVDYEINVPVCSRSGDIIEPRLMPQWFVRCDEMARMAADAVRKGELLIHPKPFEKIWFKWLDDINDWCISRQLWWGHRIPAYRVLIDGKPCSVREASSAVGEKA